MKSCLRMLMVAAVAVTGFGTASADVVVVGVNGSMSAGGTITSYDGSIFDAGGSVAQKPERWTDFGPVGTDFVGTFGGTDLSSTDWYVQSSGFSHTLGAGDNYMEIFYSLDSNVTGSNFRWAFNGSSPADAFADGELIPTTAGSHSFVIDANQLDDIGAGDTIGSIRWDPWNEESPAGPDQIRGTVFTIDRIVFGDTLTAIPEPSSLAVLAVASVGVVARRRKRTA